MYLQCENKSTHRGENRNISAGAGSVEQIQSEMNRPLLFIC